MKSYSSNGFSMSITPMFLGSSPGFNPKRMGIMSGYKDLIDEALTGGTPCNQCSKTFSVDFPLASSAALLKFTDTVVETGNDVVSGVVEISAITCTVCRNSNNFLKLKYEFC